MKLASNSMLLRTVALAVGTLASSCSLVATAEDKVGFKEGATMVALVNLHPDYARQVLYAMNYQLPAILPMCAEIKIDDIGAKEIEFIYEGATYRYAWDKYTKGAGQSLAQNFQQYFGEKCDKEKVATLSQVDQDGIKNGIPKIGMTKEGVLFAMGRPPIHANPSLDTNTWMYWANKFGKKAVDFDDNGIVKAIR